MARQEEWDDLLEVGVRGEAGCRSHVFLLGTETTTDLWLEAGLYRQPDLNTTDQ